MIWTSLFEWVCISTGISLGCDARSQCESVCVSVFVPRFDVWGVEVLVWLVFTIKGDGPGLNYLRSTDLAVLVSVILSGKAVQRLMPVLVISRNSAESG
jgi:hypothetical protein